jgi:O-acetyl-ADP-ribose deacetylase (regulator of RNase III)
VTIEFVQGDLLMQDQVDAIVNTVNSVGIMGKGIALKFKQKWPDNFALYKAACERGDICAGKMFIFDCGGLVRPYFIINFPTKTHWRNKSRIDFIRSGLDDLIRQVGRLGVQSIAIPPLGCGNGGLAWNDVRQLVEAAFAKIPTVRVLIMSMPEKGEIH